MPSPKNIARMHTSRQFRAARRRAMTDMFLRELGRSGNMTAACEAVAPDFGTTPQAIRTAITTWCRGFPGFAARLELANEESADRLELEARRRAVEGVDEPVFYQGVEVGTVRKYSDALLQFLLKARRPDVFRERVEHSGAVLVGVVEIPSDRERAETVLSILEETGALDAVKSAQRETLPQVSVLNGHQNGHANGHKNMVPGA